MGRHRLALVAVFTACGALLLASCGGSSGASSSGVASLSGSGSKKSSSSSKSSEKELLSWVQCMRKQGVDLPDPTVDANGNLTLRPPGGFGGARAATGGSQPATGASGSATPTTVVGGGTSNGATNGATNPRRVQMDAARKVCGDPPQGGVGGFNRQNSQEFQDAALKFAQCMRKNGVNVPDPNFSTGGNGDGGGGPGGGFFRNINRDDPNVQKAMNACRSIIDAVRPGGNSSTSTTVKS